jgi:uncharacterized protein YjbK
MVKYSEKKETEIKVMITKQECEKLFAKAHSIYTQVNHYYRINDDLTVRIRIIGTRYYLQYKKNAKDLKLDGVKNKIEYSCDLSESEYLCIKNNPHVIMDYLDVTACGQCEPVYLGMLETLRGNVALDDEMPDAEIDMSTYNGKVDYELEWEINENLYDKAVKILEGIGISTENREKGISKCKRFIASLNK